MTFKATEIDLKKKKSPACVEHIGVIPNPLVGVVGKPTWVIRGVARVLYAQGQTITFAPCFCLLMNSSI